MTNNCQDPLATIAIFFLIVCCAIGIAFLSGYIINHLTVPKVVAPKKPQPPVRYFQKKIARRCGIHGATTKSPYLLVTEGCDICNMKPKGVA